MVTTNPFGKESPPWQPGGQDIVSLIKRQIEEFGGDLALVDVGTVVQVGDGIASIQGLQGVRSNELLDFGNDTLGLALNLEADIVGAAILGDPNAVKEGDRVRSTGRIIEVPVGEGLMGRVVDPPGPAPGRQGQRLHQRQPLRRDCCAQRSRPPVRQHSRADWH